MDFVNVIKTVAGRLDAAGVHYALIGGFAMALRGLQRTTADLDFILALEDLEKADDILLRLGYERVFRSDNVSHYESSEQAWGRIDILHAFRSPSMGMLRRAERVSLAPDVSLPVVHTEDLIGLKIQASVNNPARALRDWADIQMMLEVAGESAEAIDWELIAEYLDIFHLSAKLPQLKAYYDGEA